MNIKKVIIKPGDSAQVVKKYDVVYIEYTGKLQFSGEATVTDVL